MRLAAGLFLCCALLAGDLSGRRAPGFSLPDSTFKQYDPQDFRGRILVLDFMRTDCPHCRVFSGVLEQVKAKYGDKVMILSIVTPPDNTSTVSRYLTTQLVTSPILFDSGQVTASYFKATPANPSIALPHVFLIDGEGIIRNDFPYRPETKPIFEGQGLFAEIDKLLNAPKR